MEEDLLVDYFLELSSVEIKREVFVTIILQIHALTFRVPVFPFLLPIRVLL